jgi:hypothetical protein
MYELLEWFGLSLFMLLYLFTLVAIALTVIWALTWLAGRGRRAIVRRFRR